MDKKVTEMTEKLHVNNLKIQDTIIAMVQQRGPEKTCCPSEVARKLDTKNWRSLMEDVRTTAISLAEKGVIDICQKGQPVTSMNFKGPIRLRVRVQSIQDYTVSTESSKTKGQSFKRDITSKEICEDHKCNDEPLVKKRKQKIK